MGLGRLEEGRALQAEGRAQEKACGPERAPAFQGQRAAPGVRLGECPPPWTLGPSWTPAQGNSHLERGLVTGQG